jgi:hypothetical protein
MFLLTNVIPVTELIISLWMHYIPSSADGKDQKRDEDLDPNENDMNPFATKSSVRDFITQICTYLKQLQDYIEQCLKDPKVKQRLNHIIKRQEIKDLKDQI